MNGEFLRFFCWIQAAAWLRGVFCDNLVDNTCILPQDVDSGWISLISWNQNHSDYGHQFALDISRVNCNIDRLSSTQMTQDLFYSKYHEKLPFIVKYDEKEFRNLEMRAECSKDRILNKYGDFHVTLSSSNSYSYDKREIALSHYINSMNNRSINNISNAMSNETFYFFGDNDYKNQDWNILFDKWQIPQFTKLSKKDITVSFGIGGIGSGVPFHIHGGGLSETIFGRKLWFLFPIGKNMSHVWNPNRTTLFWFGNEYENYKQINDDLFECVIQPNDVLYFPSNWYHATLNIDQTVFVSAFI